MEVGSGMMPWSPASRSRRWRRSCENSCTDADGSAGEAAAVSIPTAVMVGDRPSTDGRFARELGCRYAQVWSGCHAHRYDGRSRSDLVADDLARVVTQLLGPDEHPPV
ncbi:MAG: HAD hydrolase-like protein [Ilumatobacteraceae bacterium]